MPLFVQYHVNLNPPSNQSRLLPLLFFYLEFWKLYRHVCATLAGGSTLILSGFPFLVLVRWPVAEFFLKRLWLVECALAVGFSKMATLNGYLVLLFLYEIRQPGGHSFSGTSFYCKRAQHQLVFERSSSSGLLYSQK